MLKWLLVEPLARNWETNENQRLTLIYGTIHKIRTANQEGHQVEINGQRKWFT